MHDYDYGSGSWTTGIVLYSVCDEEWYGEVNVWEACEDITYFDGTVAPHWHWCPGYDEAKRARFDDHHYFTVSLITEFQE